ncbi:hypothetical protein C8F01DRAFT_1084441 [Mycena amicta]|nr:hypothetical protein C8F01DRAFT_1084441 [Mycena amicta]
MPTVAHPQTPRTLGRQDCARRLGLGLTPLQPQMEDAIDSLRSTLGLINKCKQHNTVIPESDPCAELRGKPQQMTLPNGNTKGLKSVLEERGFNVSQMRVKCKAVFPIENTD